jgi:hypothetical protein
MAQENADGRAHVKRATMELRISECRMRNGLSAKVGKERGCWLVPKVGRAALPRAGLRVGGWRFDPASWGQAAPPRSMGQRDRLCLTRGNRLPGSEWCGNVPDPGAELSVP